MSFGAHISLKQGDFLRSCELIKFLGGNVIQIFLHSPKRYLGKVNINELVKSKEYCNLHGIKLFNHSAYILNFARPTDSEIAIKSRESLSQDLINCESIGAIGTVIHMGKSLGLTENEGIQNMYNNLSLVLNNYSGPTKLILETSTGQGSEICYKFEKLKELYDLFNENQKEKISFCIDTCHVFSAGYSLNTVEETEDTFCKFDSLIGLNKVSLIHFNNSVGVCNCKKDRHAPLLNGAISEIGLKTVVRIATQHGIPLVLETSGEYLEEIQLMKEWSVRDL